MGLFQKFYNLRNWKNAPNTSTPINETNLNIMDVGINESDNRIVLLDAKKADWETVNIMVKSVKMDIKTGILTVESQNGAVVTYDLAIEKVVVNFDINDDNELVLTLADGTQKVIDLTRFVYDVDSTSTISMSINNRIITAKIVDGSVTMSKLDAAIQTEFRQYMLDAQSARDSSLQYSKLSKRYAVGDEEYEGSENDNAKIYKEQSGVSSILSKSYAIGGTGTREGEDTDNAKYYMQLAQEVSAVEIATATTLGISRPDNITMKISSSGVLSTNVFDKDGEIGDAE